MRRSNASEPMPWMLTLQGATYMRWIPTACRLQPRSSVAQKLHAAFSTHIYKPTTELTQRRYRSAYLLHEHGNVEDASEYLGGD